MAGGRAFQTCETRIGRLLLPCIIFTVSAYFTYHLILLYNTYGHTEAHPHHDQNHAQLLKFSVSEALHHDHLHHLHATAKRIEDKQKGEEPDKFVESLAVAEPKHSPPPPSPPPPSPPPPTLQRVKDEPEQELAAAASDSGRATIHVLCTSNGSPYLNWQTRMMYYTYKKVAPGSDMKYFTRLLHRREDDDLMHEVPTVRVDSLHAACDHWCEFPVADRPNALRQYLQTEDSKLGDWILMIETDYIWKKPVQAPPASQTWATCFEFGYINPAHPHVAQVVQELFPGGDVNTVPHTGPAPTMIRRADLGKMIAKYEEVTAIVENNKEYKDKLGWVREMYTYSIAAAIMGVEHRCSQGPTNPLISQVPADKTIGAAAMYHYTWGARFMDATGKVVWDWDKRPYVSTEVVRIPSSKKPELPPADTVARGLTLDGQRVTQELRDSLADLLGEMGEALTNLPNLKGCGWARDRKCTFNCRGYELCKPTETNLQ